MSDFAEIISQLRSFNQERDWDQFHNGKDLAMAISIEANELLEPFLWKSPDVVPVEKIREELADVLNYAFLMADHYGLDIKEIIMEKLAKNAQKYPVEKARGKATKYNDL
jgi:NTP pyrophosphatase (non-canonical NTP hydrolase)